MEAYGRENGSKDAVVDIIELDEDNYDPDNFSRGRPKGFQSRAPQALGCLKRVSHTTTPERFLREALFLGGL
jgi:hypothetical protein